MTLQYELKVIGLMIKGHPHQELYSSFDKASLRFDQLIANYPYNEVQFIENQPIILLRSQPKEKPIPPCPNGHKGSVDGKNIIQKGSNGRYNCTVCGEWL